MLNTWLAAKAPPPDTAASHEKLFQKMAVRTVLCAATQIHTTRREKTYGSSPATMTRVMPHKYLVMP